MQGIFRKTALDRMSTPDQLDQLMQVTKPRGWLALLTLIALLGLLVVWSVVGKVSTEIAGQGLLVKAEGIKDVQTTASGLLTSVEIKPGAVVAAGQSLAKLKEAGGQSLDIASPYAGIVTEILGQPNTLVTAGSVLVRVEPAGQTQGLAYVPLADGKRLKPGMAAYLSPTTARSGQYGFLVGQISYISPYPATTENIRSQLKNDELAQSVTALGPVLEVQVSLTQDNTSYNGLKWSASKGPHTQVTSGTLTGFTFVVGEQSPITLVLPFKSED